MFPLGTDAGAGPVPVRGLTCERCRRNWRGALYGAPRSDSAAIHAAKSEGWTRDADGYWTCDLVDCIEE